MSRLSNYIKTKRFARDGLCFFLGYIFVSLATGAGILLVLGCLGFLIFYFTVVAEMEYKK